MQAAFEDTFNEAIQQLVVWGGVFVAEDAEYVSPSFRDQTHSRSSRPPSGKRYLAHHTPSLDVACTVKVKAREAWDEWRGQIMGQSSRPSHQQGISH